MNVIQFIQPFFSLAIIIFLYVSIGNLILRKSTIIIKFFSSFSLIYLFTLIFAFFSNKFIWYFFIFIIFLFLIYYWIKNLKKIKSYNLAIFVVSQLIISPLYIYALNLPQLNWDDYATWLPNTIYFFENLDLPKNNSNHLWSAHLSYPYGFPILLSIFNLMNLNFFENSAAFLNVFIFSTFFLILKPDNKKKFTEDIIKIINLLPLLIISMLIINSKGIFGAGPDLLLCILSLLYVKNFYRQDKPQELSIKNKIFDNHFFEQILISIAIIATKQVGIYILIILNLGIFLTIILFILYKKLTISKLIKVSKQLLIITLVAYFVNNIWEIYIEKESLKGSFKFSLNDLRVDDLFIVIQSIIKSIVEKPYFFILLIINFYILKKYFYTEQDLTFYCTVSIFCNLLMILFLILGYISVFGEYEGRRAASFERYIAPMGFISLIPLSIIINKKIVKHITKNVTMILSIFLYLSLILVSKDRIIRKHDVDYKFVQKYIVEKFEKGKKINIIDLHSYGYIGHLLRFRLFKNNDIYSYDPLNTNLNSDFLRKIRKKRFPILLITTYKKNKFVKLAENHNFKVKIISSSIKKNTKVVELIYE